MQLREQIKGYKAAWDSIDRVGNKLRPGIPAFAGMTKFRSFRDPTKKPAGFPAGFCRLVAEAWVFNKLELHAAVFFAAFLGRVVRDRLGLAVADRGHATAVDATADKVGLDRVGAAFRQALVVGVGADVVGVTFQLHFQITVGLQRARQRR